MSAEPDREPATPEGGTHRRRGRPRPRPGFWSRRAVPVAVAAGLTLGFRDALHPEHEDPVVEVHEAGAPPPPGRVTLFFHPEVPEATLVLVR
jgi:hypothetical protein